MPKRYDPSRSLSTQPYRTTRAAQLVARHRTAASQIPEPQPPTHRPNATTRAAFRRAILAGHTAEEASRIANVLASLQPITSVLSPSTRATLAALEKERR